MRILFQKARACLVYPPGYPLLFLISFHLLLSSSQLGIANPIDPLKENSGSETDVEIYLPVVSHVQEPASNLSGPLVSRYINNYVEATFYAQMRYQPRQFIDGVQVDPVLNDSIVDDPGPYVGWDVLATPNSSTNTILATGNWLSIHLTRPATLAIVWRASDPIPQWLQSWERGSDVTLSGQEYPTYVRSFEEGPAVLGSVYDPQPNGGHGPKPRPTYLVLFGEINGAASLPPPVPQGFELPHPNQTCPAWVHDQYVKTEPDDELYRTWHPQIDPLYWCYFRHEHGSDPALFGGDPPVYFDYAPGKAGMSESHEGYKVYVFDDLAGHTWLVTHHMGTSGLARVCARFHSLSMAAKDNQTGELLFSVQFLGDYGKSIANRTEEPLIPPACPDQAEMAESSTGERWIGVVTLDGILYEPWRVDGRNLILGLQTADFTVNSNGSTAAICDEVTCTKMVPTGQSGAYRFIEWNTTWRLGFKANENTGVFYTDPYGLELRSTDDPDAVKQFVKPGIDFLVSPFAGKCRPDTPWQVIYSCEGQNEGINNGFNLEGALELPN